MNENNKTRAGEWFEKARWDFEAAQVLLQYGGHPDPVAVFFQQAVEKYLKGYLIARGWKLIKTHDLKLLIDEAKKHDVGFEKFYDLADRLTKHYIDEKYPPTVTDMTLEDVRVLPIQVEELLKIVRLPAANE